MLQSTAKRPNVTIAGLANPNRREFGMDPGARVPSDILSWQPPEVSATEGKLAVNTPFQWIKDVTDKFKMGDLMFVVREKAATPRVTLLDQSTLTSLCMMQAAFTFEQQTQKQKTTGKRSVDEKEEGVDTALQRGVDFDTEVFYDMHKFRNTITVAGVYLGASPVRQAGAYNEMSTRPARGAKDNAAIQIIGTAQIPNQLNNTTVVPAGAMLYLTFKKMRIDCAGALRDIKGEVRRSDDYLRQYGSKRLFICPIWYVSTNGRPPRRASFEELVRGSAQGANKYGEQPPRLCRSYKDFHVGEPIYDAAGKKTTAVITEASDVFDLCEGVVYKIGRVVHPVQPVTINNSAYLSGRATRLANESTMLELGIRTIEEVHALKPLTVDIDIKEVPY